MLPRNLLLSVLAAVSLAACNTAGQEQLNVAAVESPHYAGLPDQPSKPAVARQRPQVAGQPFIEFRSRHALSYGHTFVIFGRLNTKSEVGEIKPDMVAGLHPAGAGSELWTLGHVVFVPAETGPSDGDLEEEYVSNRFRVLLTEERYAKLVAHIQYKRANSPMWHAALYNCNLWAGEIAEYLGLKTGFHWLKPADYIEKIKELNSAPAPAG